MAIFTHVVLGANDVPKSRKFYDATLGTLGINNLGPMGENAIPVRKGRSGIRGDEASQWQAGMFANGGTLGFAAPSRAAVHEFHKAGLANGGTDEGAPGPRCLCSHCLRGIPARS